MYQVTIDNMEGHFKDFSAIMAEDELNRFIAQFKTSQAAIISETQLVYIIGRGVNGAPAVLTVTREDI